jgi:uncharacterized membrane protein YfcA
MAPPPSRPPGSPFLRPAPPPQLPPAAPALRQRAAAALCLAALSLLAMLLISNIERAVYVLTVALAVAVIALVLAISAARAAKRSGTRRPRAAVSGIVLGAAGALFSTFALIGFLMFWTQLMQYAHCMDGANTVAGKTACKQQLDNSVNSRIMIIGK